jgi:hypothetical protein
MNGAEVALHARARHVRIATVWGRGGGHGQCHASHLSIPFIMEDNESTHHPHNRKLGTIQNGNPSVDNRKDLPLARLNAQFAPSDASLPILLSPDSLPS